AGLNLSRIIKESLNNLALPGFLKESPGKLAGTGKKKKSDEIESTGGGGGYGFGPATASHWKSQEINENLVQQIAARIVGQEYQAGPSANMGSTPPGAAGSSPLSVPYIVPLSSSTGQ